MAIGLLMGWSNKFNLKMLHRVTCYVAGKVFYVECYAANYRDAREVAKAQHPNAQIVSVTAIFK
jgi:hypothetical protein